MPIIASPAYNNPQFGQIASNLAAAIYGDPEARMKSNYYNAEADNARASAGKFNAETQGLTIKNSAISGLPDIASQLVQQPGETAQAHAIRVAPFIGRLLQAGGGNADDLAKGFGGTMANIFAQGNDSDMTRSEVMQGKMPDKNFAPSAGRADQLNATAAAEDRKTKYGVANIDQSGANTRQGMVEKGQLDRLFATPLDVKPGDAIHLAPNDPRLGKIGDNNGVLRGPETVDNVRGDAGRQILNTPAGQPIASNIADVFTGKVDGVGAKAKTVSSKALSDALHLGAGSIKGVGVPANKQASSQNFAAFENSFPPDVIDRAHNAANAVLTKTGNAQDAGAAYLNELGLKPGDTFNQPGMISSLFGGKPGVVHTGDATAPLAAAPSAAPVAIPKGLPPPAQRPLGMKATGSDGVERVWTQHGWVAAAAPGPVT